MPSYRLGFIGAGNMAEAILRGALRAGVLPPADIAASDPDETRRALFRDQLGVEVFETNGPLVRRSDVLVLAVKPQTVDAVMAEVAPALGPDKLLVSIAAGVTLARLARLCTAPHPDAPPRTRPRIVRTMPNTPVLVGRGMVALSRGPDARDDDVRLVRDLFAASAAVIEVSEEKLDAVTAVSGSGPAYFFLLVEALVAAAVQAGLSPDEAATLAAGTFVGAAELLDRTGCDPADLRRRVTSPGGTTAAAIESFARDDFNSIVARAVRAAADRSRELGR